MYAPEFYDAREVTAVENLPGFGDIVEAFEADVSRANITERYIVESYIPAEAATTWKDCFDFRHPLSPKFALDDLLEPMRRFLARFSFAEVELHDGGSGLNIYLMLEV